jgi:hypothetical protein
LSDGVSREVNDSGLEDSDLTGVGIGTDSVLENDRLYDIPGSNKLTELQQRSIDEVRKNTTDS